MSRFARGNGFMAFGLALAVSFIMAQPDSVLACAACYGQSDSPLAAGMNWGIMSLLGFIGSVLGAVAAFFIYIVRRSNRMAALGEKQNTDSQTGQSEMHNTLAMEVS